jgi:hypothetical protein
LSFWWISTLSPKQRRAARSTSNVPMQQWLRQLGYQDSGRVENLDLDDPELIFVKCLSLAKLWAMGGLWEHMN